MLGIILSLFNFSKAAAEKTDRIYNYNRNKKNANKSGERFCSDGKSQYYDTYTNHPVRFEPEGVKDEWTEKYIVNNKQVYNDRYEENYISKTVFFMKGALKERRNNIENHNSEYKIKLYDKEYFLRDHFGVDKRIDDSDEIDFARHTVFETDKGTLIDFGKRWEDYAFNLSCSENGGYENSFVIKGEKSVDNKINIMLTTEEQRIDYANWIGAPCDWDKEINLEIIKKSNERIKEYLLKEKIKYEW